MFRSNQRRQGMSIAIFGLWRNWAVAVGILITLMFLAPIVPSEFLAPLDLVAFFVLIGIRSILRRRQVPSCSRLMQEVSIVIIVMAIAMLVLNFIDRSKLFNITGQPVNDDSPFLGVLILAPLTSIVTLCFLLNRREPLVCQQCKMRYGNVIEHGFIGGLFRREWRYQTKILWLLSFILSVVDWGYYLIYYINVNLNRADLFYFLWLPLVIYVLSLIYLGMRYYSMWVYYCQNDEGHYVENPGTTTLRYLIIYDDRIFLSIIPTEQTASKNSTLKRFDTPAIVKMPYYEMENLPQALSAFRSATGIVNADIRQIYTSPDNITYQNIFHYFAFIQNMDDVANSKLEGEWYSLGSVKQLIDQQVVGRDLVAELRRIYKVAMTWKTYDPSGKRLYDIKHYRPTFRLKDLKTWDVDYNDDNWLVVSRCNEDKLFYQFNKIFRVVSRK